MCHMKKTFRILIILTVLYSCSEQKKETIVDKEKTELIQGEPIFNLVAYVANPEPNDEWCISDIKKAKADIEKNGVVFTQAVGFLFGYERYEDELIKLCEEKGLKYKTDLIGCVVVEGQTQGCYGAYMDKVLIDKYGKDFKKEMHKKADSLFLVNAIKKNIAVDYYDCDEPPKLPNRYNRYGIPNLTVTTIDIQKDKSEFGSWPFFDVGFIVERDSTISNIHINSYVAGLESNEKYKEQLFELVTENIRTKYPNWVPGIINGVQVRTDNNVRVYLVRE